MTRGPGYKQPPDWKKIRARIFDRDGNTCRICERPAVTVDHIVSVAEALAMGREPDHSEANLQSLCAVHKALKDEQDRLKGIARRQARRGSRRNHEQHPNRA